MSNTQKLPCDLTELERHRICWRVARGMPWVQAAAMEGILSLYAEALAQDRALVEQIETFKKRADDPEEERHMRLLEMAINVLETRTIAGERDGETIISEEDGRTIN